MSADCERRMSGPPAIMLDKVNKWYGTMHVLRDISLTVAEKERVVVCGPSGSGKSTMIRCINRLETHQEGRIIVDGTELTDDTARAGHDPARGRHGVSVVQSVPASDDSGELHAGADLGAQDAEGPGGGIGDEVSAAGARSRSRRRNIPASYRVASSSAWRSPGRCACSRKSCCSTSRPRRWIRR